MYTRNLKRLPLDTVYNARDLGGYHCEGDKSTKWGALVRTDDLHYMNEYDKAYVINYGIKTIIDLRGEEELESNPNALADNEHINYHNISLMIGETKDATKQDWSDFENALPNFYIAIIEEGKERLREVFEIIEGSKKGGVLFHCTAGKDRTGVLAMLLLGLAGASEGDIINNYSETYYYLRKSPYILSSTKNMDKKMIEALKRLSDKERQAMLQSRPEYIERVLEHIENKYGSIKEYLLYIGLSEKTLTNIKDRICE